MSASPSETTRHEIEIDFFLSKTYPELPGLFARYTEKAPIYNLVFDEECRSAINWWVSDYRQKY